MTDTQVNHSDRRNGALYGLKGRITAFVFTVFRRNPSSRFTSRFFWPGIYEMINITIINGLTGLRKVKRNGLLSIVYATKAS
jgi:hypothetical protein